MPLGKRTDYGDAKYAGVELEFAPDVVVALEESVQGGFDFVVVPLSPSRGKRVSRDKVSRTLSAATFTKSDNLLTSTQWSNQVVGRVSTWIDPDSDHERIRTESISTLKHELGWAGHLGLQAVVLPPPVRWSETANYSQVLLNILGGLTNMALWLRLPLVPHLAPVVEEESMEGSEAEGLPQEATCEATADPLHCWQRMYHMTDYHPLLGVVLEIPASLPAPSILNRWLGQPLRAVMVPTSIFLTNRRGYPILSKAHQDLLVQVFKHNVQVILSGCGHHQVTPGHAPTSSRTEDPSPDPPFSSLDFPALGSPMSSTSQGPQDSTHPEPPTSSSSVAPDKMVVENPGGGIAVVALGEQHPLKPYWEYICYLFRKLETISDQAMLEAPYRDYLQAPLQPLQDNLEAQTYEVFEKDTTKYVTYEEAVYKALIDRVPEEDKTDKVTVIMVVGAGRGPLVRASLRASERAGRQVQIYAVEKNPNAVYILQHLMVSESWEGKVTLVSADMRSWEAPELADILVSELLGSFGDNELSPECLDGAQRFLAPGGISIPSSYTSYLAPITSTRLWSTVRDFKELKHFETPYVVKLHRAHLLAPPQAVFSFSHPNREENIDNSRSTRLHFDRKEEDGCGVLHGFAGYFETVLYGDVLLSTHPSTHTPNMFSWFPIYFPLKNPMYLPQGAAITVHMWRCCTRHKVWYEWAVANPQVSTIHNPNGRSYFVGL